MAGVVGIGYAVVAAAGLAAQSLAVRRGTDTARVTDVLAVVFAVNLLVLVPMAAVAGPPTGLTPTVIGAFAVAGLVGSLLGRACYYVGIARLGASRAEPLKALLPLFAVGGAVVLLEEPVTPVVAAGVCLLVVGGAAVALEARSSPVTATGRRFWIDASFPVLAALLYGIDPVFAKFGLSAGGSAIVGVAIRVTAAAAGFAAYWLWRLLRTGSVGHIDAGRWLVVAGVANTVYLLAYYAALVRLPVSVVAPVMGLSTLFVVVGAAVFLQDAERVTWRLAAAASLVVLGVAVVVTG